MTQTSRVTEFLANPAAMQADYPAAFLPTLSRAEAANAFATISAWQGYAPTPLVALPDLARDSGVASIHYKQESGRFGLGSFKALGGAYAVLRLLTRLVSDHEGGAVPAAEIKAGQHNDFIAGITVCCATDGNHGRSVAWGGRMFGCKVVIFVHATVSEGRAEAIRHFGAQVIRTAGNYDDSVREAARMADENGWFVVSDTSYPGYTDVPRDVMQGYGVLAEEALRDLPAPPTHIFLQGGVGGFAAAVAATFWEAMGERRPRIVIVEPDRAACLLASARAGKPVAVTGDLDTIMAGLACGEPSLIAWPILQGGADGFVSVADGLAEDAMRLLASGQAGARLVAGESAVAGLAGYLALGPAERAALGIDAASRLFFIGSEGDTDPELYAEIIGETGDALRAKGAV